MTANTSLTAQEVADFLKQNPSFLKIMLMFFSP